MDDGSKESYINSDVAAELVLDGLVETATVSTMNRNVMTFQTTSVECETRSIDGKVEYNVSTYIHNTESNWENETNRMESTWVELATSEVYQIPMASSSPSD